MLDELKSVSLCRLAQEMDTDPFELMRLRVYSESDLTHLTLPSSQAVRLRAFSGIETLCKRVPPSSEGQPLEGHRWVPGLLLILLADERIGENTVRMDNLWRGLSEDDGAIVKNIIQVLLKDGLLVNYASVQGIQISIHPNRVDEVEALAKGQSIPESLAYLWKA